MVQSLSGASVTGPGGVPLTGPQRAQAEEVAKQRGPWMESPDPLASYVQMHG